MRRQEYSHPEEVEAPAVWIARITGTQTRVAVYVSREQARRWIESVMKSGDWDTGTWQDQYDAGPDTGIVRFAEIKDAEGIVWTDLSV